MQAIYKGVTFFVDDIEYSGGKRGKSWTFPFNDNTYNQELGASPTKIRIDGHIIKSIKYDKNEVHIQQKEKMLREAFTSSGSGIFTDKYYGDLQATVYTYNFKRSSTEDKIIRFSAEFTIEFNVKPAQVLTNMELINARTSLKSSLLTDFVNKFSIVGKAVSIVNDASKAIDNAHETLKTGMQEALSSSVAFKKSLMTLNGKTISLLYDPLVLFTTIQGLTEEPSTFLESFRILQSMNDKLIDDGSPASKINYFLALNVLANISTQIITENNEDKLSINDKKRQIIQYIDTILESIESDDIFSNIIILKNKMIKWIELKINSMPDIYTFKLPRFDSAFNILYKFQTEYTPDRIEVLLSRNNLVHPLFIPAGIELEVVNG